MSVSRVIRSIGGIGISFSLSTEERRKREGAQIRIHRTVIEEPQVTVDEISNQIRNIAKWRNFRKTIKDLELK
jgi:hypothetical protein